MKSILTFFAVVVVVEVISSVVLGDISAAFQDCFEALDIRFDHTSDAVRDSLAGKACGLLGVLSPAIALGSAALLVSLQGCNWGTKYAVQIALQFAMTVTRVMLAARSVEGVLPW